LADEFLEAEMKAFIGCAAVLIVLAATTGAEAKGCLKSAAVVALQGTIRATMDYWERRLAALSDVTKPTSTTACKEIRSINLTAICEMERNASNAIAG
jgi:hypothetical protein